MVMSEFRPEVEIWPFCACTMHPAIIIGTVCSLWTRLWGRYHVSENAFLVIIIVICFVFIVKCSELLRTQGHGSKVK